MSGASEIDELYTVVFRKFYFFLLTQMHVKEFVAANEDVLEF